MFKWSLDSESDPKTAQSPPFDHILKYQIWHLALFSRPLSTFGLCSGFGTLQSTFGLNLETKYLAFEVSFKTSLKSHDFEFFWMLPLLAFDLISRLKYVPSNKTHKIADLGICLSFDQFMMEEVMLASPEFSPFSNIGLGGIFFLCLFFFFNFGSSHPFGWKGTKLGRDGIITKCGCSSWVLIH